MSFIRDAERDVELFERAMDGRIGNSPAMPDEATRRLRASLIGEEVVETIAALGFDVSLTIHPANDRQSEPVAHFNRAAAPSLSEVADGIADSIFVELGTAVAAGIDMEPVWDAVVKTNLAKASGPRRADGKRLKPEGWSPPDIDAILRAQGWDGGCDFGCCPAENPCGCTEPCDGLCETTGGTD